MFPKALVVCGTRGRQGKRTDATLWRLPVMTTAPPVLNGTSTSNVLVQSLSCVRLFATPWIAARQASLSFGIFRSLLKHISIESVMPSNHFILCRLHLLPSIFPSIGIFFNESALSTRWPKYWSFSFSLSPVHQSISPISIFQ